MVLICFVCCETSFETKWDDSCLCRWWTESLVTTTTTRLFVSGEWWMEWRMATPNRNSLRSVSVHAYHVSNDNNEWLWFMFLMILKMLKRYWRCWNDTEDAETILLCVMGTKQSSHSYSSTRRRTRPLSRRRATVSASQSFWLKDSFIKGKNVNDRDAWGA